jgi:hypothetical protein
MWNRPKDTELMATWHGTGGETQPVQVLAEPRPRSPIAEQPWQHRKHHQRSHGGPESEVDETHRNVPAHHVGHTLLNVDHVGELQRMSGVLGELVTGQPAAESVETQEAPTR